MIRSLVACVLTMSAVALGACGGEEAPAAPPSIAVPIVEPVREPGREPVGEPVAEGAAPTPLPEPVVAAPPRTAAPVVLAPGGADQARMAIGASRGLAIGADGRVYEFPLAAGSTSTIAQPVDGVEHAESVATFAAVACVVTSERRVLCWSDGRAGEQTVASIGTTPAPIEAFLDAQAVVVTSRAVCARDTAGAVTCVGRGLLGESERTDSAFSFPLPRAAVEIAGAAQGLCAVLDDGTLHCTGTIGRNSFTGDRGPRAVRTPFPVRSIALHTFHLCVRSANSDAVACGGDVGAWFYEDIDYEDDERGSENAMDAPVDDFTFVDVPIDVVAIATNENHACAVMAGGGLHCWGMPYRDGRTEGFISRAAPGMRGVTELVAGGPDLRGYTCAIQGDLPVCFTSERTLARGTPGRPRFTICSAQGPDGSCIELRLAARGRTRAAPPIAAPVVPEVGAPATSPSTSAERSCVVADPSGTPLNVRADGNARAATIGTLANGTPVTTDETRGRFRHLTAPLVGWAWSDNLACP